MLYTFAFLTYFSCFIPVKKFCLTIQQLLSVINLAGVRVWDVSSTMKLDTELPQNAELTAKTLSVSVMSCSV